MKRQTVIAVAWLAAVLGSGFGFAADEPLALRDSVVAVVNKQVITLREVLDRSGPALAELDKDNSLSQDERRRRKMDLNATVLRQMVAEKLLVAEGNRLLNANEGFKKHFDESVESRIQDERRNAGGEAALRESLQKKGLTYQAYTEQVRDRTLMDYVRYQFVMRDLSVAPREVREYYEQNLNQFEEPARVKFRGIFIRVTEMQNRAAARKSAQELLLQLKGPADFAQVAKQRSALHAEDGGLWDFTEQGTLPKQVDDLVFSLPVGEIGGPVETEMPGASGPESGFLIVKVEERKPARTRAFEEVQRPIEEMLLARKRISRFDALMHRLETENYVEYVQ
ncbi:MAG: peptidyl-prolyl cis-trans isomerase [Candidatus Brocadiia bacterium]|jgi:parvulin-like peptidyl-prolyl isomerase